MVSIQARSLGVSRMTSVVINIDVAIERGSQAKATFHAAKNSQGVDISDTFQKYCHDDGLRLDTQADIEKAAVDFSDANADWLP
jgi:hypothetical protein